MVQVAAGVAASEITADLEPPIPMIGYGDPADRLATGVHDPLAARALVRTQYLDVGDDPGSIVEEFRTRFYDTRLFFDRFARGKFAEYLFKRHEAPPAQVTADFALQVAEEAHLFIEAAHACEARLANAASGAVQIQ